MGLQGVGTARCQGLQGLREIEDVACAWSSGPQRVVYCDVFVIASCSGLQGAGVCIVCLEGVWDCKVVGSARWLRLQGVGHCKVFVFARLGLQYDLVC